MENDYYKILNISENSSNDEIKKAYRKLSLQHHPDRNNGSIESETTFKKINEAYNTLSDPHKKRNYDLEKTIKNGGMRNTNITPGDLFSEIIMKSNLFGEFQETPFGEPFKNIFASNPNIKIFHNGFQMNIPEKPCPIIKNININIEQILEESIIPVEIERWFIENNKKMFEKEVLYITIPAGIDNNEMIVLKEKGNIGMHTIKGDVKLIFHIINNTSFLREGLDLSFIKTITLKEALTGFTFELKHINGNDYNVNIYQGFVVVPNYRKVISNLGLKRDKHTGNLNIIFVVEFPKTLEIDVIEKLKEIL
jgi:DnaJ-class molecular chaperone